MTEPGGSAMITHDVRAALMMHAAFRMDNVVYLNVAGGIAHEKYQAR